MQKNILRSTVQGNMEKTTTLWALKNYLQKEYFVVFINFQQLNAADYRDEYTFTAAFADLFVDALNVSEKCDSIQEPFTFLQDLADLGQLRVYYLNESRKQTFWSVVLTGVYDIKNLKLKI